jgi:hypothetical protein
VTVVASATLTRTPPRIPYHVLLPIIQSLVPDAPRSTATPTPESPARSAVYFPLIIRNPSPTPTQPASPPGTPTQPSSAIRTPTQPASPQATPTHTGWVTILREDFEGTFPGSWVVQDAQNGYGEYFWGKRTCQRSQGTYSAWAIGGGANGSTLGCGSSYYYYTKSWMTYGRFSLTDAAAANAQFDLWLNSERGYDDLCIMASVNAYDYYGDCWSGRSSGWTHLTFNLADVYQLGSLLGHPDVWIAFIFRSDVSYNYSEGAYVDSIVLQKYVSSPAQADSAVPDDSTNEQAIPESMTREIWHLTRVQ